MPAAVRRSFSAVYLSGAGCRAETVLLCITMATRPYYQRITKALAGRVARNVYFWCGVLYLTFGLNSGNERVFHYGIIHSPWYLPVMAGCLLLQLALVYTNNGLLVPRLLAKRRKLAYAAAATLLTCFIALLTTLLLKAATVHINTAELQQPGLTNTILSPGDWRLKTIFYESQTFMFSDALWLFAFTMAWYMSDYARQQKALRLSEEQRTVAELAFLKSQINPHFLFNTLNNIYGLSLNKSEAAPEAILKLSAMLRYLLYESSVSAITFAQERAAIEAYAEIETLRLPDDADVRLELAADADYRVPPLLWLPLLENAFKHGTRLIDQPVSVHFRFAIQRGVLEISTQNHYSAEEAPPTPTGIGLANLRKRLDILFQGLYTLQASGDGKLFTTHLTIQLA